MTMWSKIKQWLGVNPPEPEPLTRYLGEWRRTRRCGECQYLGWIVFLDAIRAVHVMRRIHSLDDVCPNCGAEAGSFQKVTARPWVDGRWTRRGTSLDVFQEEASGWEVKE